MLASWIHLLVFLDAGLKLLTDSIQATFPIWLNTHGIIRRCSPGSRCVVYIKRFMVLRDIGAIRCPKWIEVVDLPSRICSCISQTHSALKQNHSNLAEPRLTRPAQIRSKDVFGTPRLTSSQRGPCAKMSQLTGGHGNNPITKVARGQAYRRPSLWQSRSPGMPWTLMSLACWRSMSWAIFGRGALEEIFLTGGSSKIGAQHWGLLCSVHAQLEDPYCISILEDAVEVDQSVWWEVSAEIVEPAAQ